MTTTTSAHRPTRQTRTEHALEPLTAEFLAVQNRLRRIAYRIVGCRDEADDIVQEAWLRWQLCNRSAVINPTAFLVTTTTRLALNAASSARARREAYVGDWHSEPDTSGDPTAAHDRREELEMAIRTMLERLTTDELVAYVLRQAFAYPYARIAILAGTSETNARQLVSRAGRRLRVAGPRRRIRPLDERRLAAALVAAARSGNVSGLEELLTSQLRPAPRRQVGQEAAA